MPEQGQNSRERLCSKVNNYMLERNIGITGLARESGQSRSTINRMVSFKDAKEAPSYRHSHKTIMAVALALHLNLEQTQELFEIAFPEQVVWREATEKGWSIEELDDRLDALNLPTIVNAE